jgi:membrane dipeptidase
MSADAAVFMDLHSHWLINGHYLRHPLSALRPDRLPFGPFGNRIDIEDAARAGVRCVTFTAYAPVSPLFWVPRSEATLAQIRTFYRVARESGGRLRPARTGVEARAAAADGAVAGVLAVEGGHSLDGNPAMLDAFAELGVRFLTLVHFKANELGDAGESSRKPWGGLSPLGREVVSRMRALRIVPDVAHLSDDGVHQVLDLTDGPVVSTHTGMRALVDRPRNLPDGQARGIARSGGVVGIILFPPYLDGRHPMGQSVDRFLDHVCHAAWVMGPRHVAVGSDMDGFTWTPRGLRGYADWPILSEGLARRGFSPPEIQGILGGNALRVLDA